MKKLLFLLLCTVSMYGQTLQNPTYGTVKLKQNTTDLTAEKVSVQSVDGSLNTIAKTDLINVVERDSYSLLPTSGAIEKLYVTKDTNKLYRWNGSTYVDVAYVDVSGKADLDASGKVPLTQIPESLLGSVNFKSVYNASTNTPALPTVSSSNKGWYYVVSVAGTQQGLNLAVGDWIISNGTSWGKVDNNNNVTNVFGRVGSVTAQAGDYTASQVTNAESNLNKKTAIVSSDTDYPTSKAVIDYVATSVPDATTTVKGKTKLAGDLGGTADLPTTPTALHKTGNETKTSGTTTFTDEVITAGLLTANRVRIVNPATDALYISNIGSTSGIFVNSEATGSNNHAIQTTQSTSANGIVSNGQATAATGASILGLTTNGTAVQGQTQGTGSAFKAVGGVSNAIVFEGISALSSRTSSINEAGTITGTSLVKSGAPTTNLLLAGGGDISQNGLPYVDLTSAQTVIGKKTFASQTTFNSLTSFFSGVDFKSDITVSNNSTGNISLVTVNGNGANTNYKSILTDAVNGSGFVSNSVGASTGFNFVGQNNGANTFTVNKTGDVVAKSVTLTGQTATSAVLAGGGVLANPISGTGATNYLPKITGTRTIGNSNIYDNGNVGIGTNNPLAKFVVSNSGAETIEFGYSGGISASYIQSINRSTGIGASIAYYLTDSAEHVFYTNSIKVLTIKASGVINYANTPIYTNNTTALAGGLVAGDIYRTAVGVLMITY